MFKVIIAGGRDFMDYDLLRSKCNNLLCEVALSDVRLEIVSGQAKGADQLGEQYAIDSNLQIKKFPADWNTHGKSAGYIRNKEMAEYADALIAFWDGKSRGTHNMIKIAKQNDLKVRVIRYE